MKDEKVKCARVINFERRENRLTEQDMFNLSLGLVKLIRKNTMISLEKKYKIEQDKLLNRLEILLRENNRLRKELALCKK